jgi:hypothetical protein
MANRNQNQPQENPQNNPKDREQSQRGGRPQQGAGQERKGPRDAEESEKARQQGRRKLEDEEPGLDEKHGRGQD